MVTARRSVATPAAAVALLVVLSALMGVLVAVEGRPEFQDDQVGASGTLFRFPGSGTGAQTGHVSHSFHSTGADGRATHLEVSGVLADDGVVLLDGDKRVESVVCTADFSTLMVVTGAGATSSTPAIDWAAGNIVVGGPEWGCGLTADKQASPIMRRISAVRQLNAMSWELTTTAVAIFDVFKHLNATVVMNQHPAQLEPVDADADPAADTNEAAAATYPSRRLQTAGGRKLFSFRHLIHDAGNAVHNVVHTVSHAVAPVVKPVEHAIHSVEHAVSHAGHSIARAVTKTADKVGHSVRKAAKDAGHVIAKVAHSVGDIILDGISVDINKTPQLAAVSYNYGNGGAKRTLDIGSSHGVSAKCDDCFAHADLAVHVELIIRDHHVKTATIAFEGNADIAVGVNVEADEKVDAVDLSKELAKLHVATRVFMIGPVPVIIQVDVPIEAGLTVSLDAHVSAGASYRASGAITFGFNYDGSRVNWLHEHSFSHETHFQKPTGSSAGVDITGWVQPSLEATAELFFFLNAGIRPKLDAHVEAAKDGSCDLRLTETLKVDLTLSGGLHLVHDWDLGDWPVWSDQLGSQCLATVKEVSHATTSVVRKVESRGARRLDAAAAAPTATYLDGVAQPSCATQCVIATGLKACAHLNGLPVCFGHSGLSMADVDASIAEARQAYATNGPICADQAIALQCDLMLPRCDLSAAKVNGAPALVPVSTGRCNGVYRLCGASAVAAEQMCTACQTHRTCPVVADDVDEPSIVMPASGQCTAVSADSVSYCVHRAGSSAYLRTDLYPTVADADAAARQFVQDAFNATSSCLPAAKVYACAVMLPECGATGAVPMCLNTCVNAMSSCAPADMNLQDLCATDPNVASTVDAACGQATVTVADVVAVPRPAPASSAPAWWSGPAFGVGIAAVVAFAVIVAGVIVAVLKVRARKAAAAASQVPTVAEWNTKSVDVTVNPMHTAA